MSAFNGNGRVLNKTAEVAVFALLGCAVGLAVGAVVGIFGRGVEYFSSLGASHFSLYVWFLPLAGLATVCMLKKFGGGGIGMAAAFRASRGETDGFALRNAFFQFAGTWSAHLFCASVGREGAAIQIGAAIGCGIGKTVPVKDAVTNLIVAGMAAGFSALFATPVCALVFALEVTVVGGVRLRALAASSVSSFTAFFTARLCGLSHGFLPVPEVAQFALSSVLPLLALGIACGLAGFSFCVIRKFSAVFFRRAAPNPYVRVAAAGILLSCLLYLTGGRYSGLGTNLIGFAFSGSGVYAFDWIVKILFTAVTLAVGFLGGEVTTFFAAGACLGSAVGSLLGIDPVLAACLGYAAVFGAATNTLFAPVLLCVESFGGALLPHAALVCITAYFFNFGHSVYNQRVREDVVVRTVRRMRVQNGILPLPKRLY